MRTVHSTVLLAACVTMTWAAPLVAKVSAVDPCSLYYSQQSCEDLSPLAAECEWGADQTSTSGILACFSRHCVEYAAETDCIAASCEWHASAYICTVAGGNVPCSRLQSQADCAQQAACTWAGAANVCYQTSDGFPCTYFMQQDCPTANGCTYNTATYQCENVNKPVDCNSIFMQDSCMAANCTWDVTICVANGASVPCNRFYDQTSCPTALCQWILNTCLGKNETPACELGLSLSTCDVTRCTWHDSPVFLCWETGRPVTCNRYKSQDVCVQDPLCEYESANLACVDCSDPSGMCAAPTSGPTSTDNGLACAAIATEDACLVDSDRCIYDFSDINRPDGYCRDKGCGDEYDQATCTVNITCSWDNADGICYSGDHVPCDRHYQLSLCNVTFCNWWASANICLDKGLLPPCDVYSMQSTCQSQGNCEWHSDAYRCWTQGVPFPCDQYSDQVSCANDLACRYINGVGCWNKTEPVSCDRFVDSTLCNEEAHCIYDSNLLRCIPCNGSACSSKPTLPPTADPNVPCEAYTDIASCTVSSKCKWDFVGSTGIEACQNKTCADFYTASDCSLNSICSWSPLAFICYANATGIPCSDFFLQADCAAQSNCSWDGTVNVCLGRGDQPTCDLYPEATCPSSRAVDPCVWDNDAFVCHCANCPLGCAYYHDQAACPSSCAWDNAAQICHDPGQQVSCQDYVTQADCPASRCSWSSSGGCQVVA